MSGITKTCIICKNPFNTRSLTSHANTQENWCQHCYQNKKRTSVQSDFINKVNNVIMSVEDRLDKLEKSQEMIPMIIGAELSNAMLDINGITGLDLEGLIKNTVNAAKDEMLKHQAKEVKAFKKKLQGQIVTLNNKIIKLMQEA